MSEFMNFRRIFFGNTEYRVLAVGAYSFAAFSVATLVQILSSGTASPEILPHLARVAYTIMPLLAAGLALDFYCINHPKMAWLAAVLCAFIGGMIGVSSTSMGFVLGFYSAQVAAFMNYGAWSGVAILLTASVASWYMDAGKSEKDSSSKSK
jgi:hypothetical protein